MATQTLSPKVDLYQTFANEVLKLPPQEMRKKCTELAYGYSIINKFLDSSGGGIKINEKKLLKDLNMEVKSKPRHKLSEEDKKYRRDILRTRKIFEEKEVNLPKYLASSPYSDRTAAFDSLKRNLDETLQKLKENRFQSIKSNLEKDGGYIQNIPKITSYQLNQNELQNGDIQSESIKRQIDSAKQFLNFQTNNP